MRETWYKLEDGGVADPREVAPDDNGVLRHKSGVAVAMRGEVPHGIGVDVSAEQAKTKTRDLKAESSPKRGYKTRELKAG